MVNQIKQKYNEGVFNFCNEKHFDSFFINDSLNGKCSTSLSSVGSTCLIKNTNKNEINFIAIDSCLITDSTIKKCDAVVINSKTIWFIELKEIDQTGSIRQFRKRKRNHRKKAMEQIASTINDFKNKGVNFSGYLVAGLISFPPFPSISMPTNIPKTSTQTRILQFQNLCGFTEIREGNYIVF